MLATILAHPDDETFGTGGTHLRYADEGVDVHSLCLTEGEQGWAGGARCLWCWWRSLWRLWRRDLDLLGR